MTSRAIAVRISKALPNDALQPTGAALTTPHPAPHLVEAPAADRRR
jgi:hypothetical protein